MSDLPESIAKARQEVLANAFLDKPFVIDSGAPLDQEALRAQQYLAAQSFHIRQALERIAEELHTANRS